MYINNSIRISLLKPGIATEKKLPNLHLNFLTKDDISVWNGKQYIASKQLQGLQVIEAKGTFETDWNLDLLSPACFWLHFQFMGRSQRDSKLHTALSDNEYRGFYSLSEAHKIQVKTGRTSMVLLGVNMDNTAAFTSEWPRLAKPKTVDQPYFSNIHISYRIKQIFDKIQQCKDTPYSLHHNMHYHFCQLIDVYNQDLEDKARSLHKEDIVIYHEAIDYIAENYMDEDINRDTIAESLGITPRKLYRALQGRNTNIHKAIQTIRLYKGREMLQETDMSVDGIAFQLNFSTAKYFYRQYVQLFGHSPSKEREMYRKSKKKKKR